MRVKGRGHAPIESTAMIALHCLLVAGLVLADFAVTSAARAETARIMFALANDSYLMN
jgi:hypothetical protein